MIIGERLRQIREQKNLSQGDIEHKTGLLRCYVSRVENGHTVPAIETLEKFARALEVPMYQLFYDSRSRPSYQFSRSARVMLTLRGAAKAKMHVCLPCSVVYSAA